MAQSYMGVRFKVLGHEYSMALRSVNYGILFMVLVFVTLGMFEVLSGIRIHAI
jgi:inner membrane protein involved in colicin E2 resistance